MGCNTIWLLSENPYGVFLIYDPQGFSSNIIRRGVSRQLPRRGYRSIAYLRTIINPISRRELRSIIFTITNMFQRIGIIIERKPLRGMRMWVVIRFVIERKPLRGMRMWVAIRFVIDRKPLRGFFNL